MISFMYYRVKNNLTLYALLLVGAIIASTVFSSIPIYTNSVLHRVLMEGIEQEYSQTGIHPGTYTYRLSSNRLKYNTVLDEMGNRITIDGDTSLKLPILSYQALAKSNNLRIEKRPGEINAMTCRLATLSDLNEHVEMVSGTSFSELGMDNGVVEVMVTRDAMIDLNLILDTTYSLEKNKQDILEIKVIGVFDPRVESYYWQNNIYEDLGSSIIVHPDVFDELILNNGEIDIDSAMVRRVYDYEAINNHDVATIIDQHNQEITWARDKSEYMFVEFSVIPTLESYLSDLTFIKRLFWILTIPIVIITGLYTWMISTLIIQNDQNEIALLKSRGSSGMQIFMMYGIQSLIMALIASIIGPFLGKQLCLVIGASNGFLAFVNRESVEVIVDAEAFLYGALAAGIFFIAVMIPTYFAGRLSIVQYKRKKNKVKGRSFYEVIFLDIILLGVSLYGFYDQMSNKELLSEAGGSGNLVNPMMFILSTTFLLGINLLVIRLYPYLLRGIFALGKKIWNPVIYYSLISAGRPEPTSKFIMLFIMLALSFGILNASQARTINQNEIDSLYYHNGADIVVKPYDDPNLVPRNFIDLTAQYMAAEDDGIEHIIVDSVPYSDYVTLEGVEAATKVFSYDRAIVSKSGRDLENTRILAIEPKGFVDVGWYREDMLPDYRNVYMNALISVPNSAFLSTNLHEDYGFEAGDEIIVQWDQSLKGGDEGYISLVVRGFIDTFSTYNPYIEPEINLYKEETFTLSSNEITKTGFVLFNYHYLEDQLPPQNFDIWLKKAEGVSDHEIQQQLSVNNLETDRVTYTNQQVISAKNDPTIQGINGILTMSFLIILLITCIGYLIFWIMNIRNRALKFGIFRAIGMSASQVYMILVIEQVLMTGVAVVFGLLTGIYASKLFIPMLQMVSEIEKKVPKFIVIILRSDIEKITVISSAMLLLGLTILIITVRKWKVDQILKLGED